MAQKFLRLRVKWNEKIVVMGSSSFVSVDVYEDMLIKNKNQG